MAGQEVKDLLEEIDEFDLTDVDEFDVVELDPEDKVLLSPKLKAMIRREIVMGISLAKKAMEADLMKKIQPPSKLDTKPIDEKINKTSKDIAASLKEKEEKLEEKISALQKKHDDLRNGLLSTPQYQFGGFAPPNPLNHVNEVLTSTDGTWSGLAWAPGGGSGTDTTKYWGDENTDGSWRITVASDNLSVQKRESGVWVEKGAYVP